MGQKPKATANYKFLKGFHWLSIKPCLLQKLVSFPSLRGGCALILKSIFRTTLFFMTSARLHFHKFHIIMTIVFGQQEYEFAPFFNLRLAESHSLKSSSGTKYFHTSLKSVQSLTAWIESSIIP